MNNESMFDSQNCGGCNYFFVTEYNDNKVKPTVNIGTCRVRCPTVIAITNMIVKPTMNQQKQLVSVPVQEVTLQPVYPTLKSTDKGCAQHSRFDESFHSIKNTRSN